MFTEALPEQLGTTSKDKPSLLHFKSVAEIANDSKVDTFNILT